jgi:hypothetical protein
MGFNNASVTLHSAATAHASSDVPDLADRSSIGLLDEEQLNLRLRDAINLAADVSKPVGILFSPSDAGSPWLEYNETECARPVKKPGELLRYSTEGCGRVTGVGRKQKNRRLTGKERPGWDSCPHGPGGSSCFDPAG